MGIPLTLFTCLFAVGRSAGWVAQWLEALAEPKRRISRPRQVYVGETRRAYPDVRARELSGRPNLKRSFTDSTQAAQDRSFFTGRFFRILPVSFGACKSRARGLSYYLTQQDTSTTKSSQ